MKNKDVRNIILSRNVLLGLLTILQVVFHPGRSLAESIVNSKHNLSVTGPGPVKAVSESEVCIFCHIPHSSSPRAPLWNRYDSGQTYIPYSSTTTRATIGQPSGASKLCLSCHDGTVALGMVLSRQDVIATSGAMSAQKKLGTDLSDDHPVSFTYDASLAFQNPQLKNPSTLTDRVRLDSSGQMQCTSCHDPHYNQYGDFLVMDKYYGALCMSCHQMQGWEVANQNPHRLSWKFWAGSPPDPNPFPREEKPYIAIEEVACESCHNPHNAQGKARLLNYRAEEENCFPCHNGTVAFFDIKQAFNKLSHHPIESTVQAHDAAEPALVSSSKHVECADCHNPHSVSFNDTADLNGALRGVKGVSINGQPVVQASYEHEICFRCHGDTASPPRTYVNRQFPHTNIRQSFNPANASYHPVAAIGRNQSLPSAKQGFGPQDKIKCSHCHLSDNSVLWEFGLGPRGPHGSIYAPILGLRMEFRDGITESPNTYALCYACHNRNSILDDRSFPKHRKHVEEERTSCSVCHDPHGVQSVPHLINFDLNVVSPDSQGRLRFEDLGEERGRCYLTCHGEEHNPEEY